MSTAASASRQNLCSPQEMWEIKCHPPLPTPPDRSIMYMLTFWYILFCFLCTWLRSQ